MLNALLTHLSSLIAFDTTSRNSNLELITYLEAELEKHGLPFTRIANASGTKANLLARIGPEAPGGIVLSGHTDVVPVDGQKWATPPFTLSKSGTRWHGRGTADMKSFSAAMLALLPELTARTLKRPVYFAFTYDEEVGCLGAPDLARHIVARVAAPSLVVIGEPTEMRVVTAHKGIFSYETVVTGHEAHSSQPHRGVNAVHIAAKLVHFLVTLAEEYAARGRHDEKFEPPFTTVHVGVIEGGTARNIIPRQCRFAWEVRPLPGERAEEVIERFEHYCDSLRATMRGFPDAGIATAMRSRMQAMQLPESGGLVPEVMAAAQANATHCVSFGTEAGVYQDHGLPVLVCGPGSIDQAHQPDEFIEEAQLEKCLEFLRRLIMID